MKEQRQEVFSQRAMGAACWASDGGMDGRRKKGGGGARGEKLRNKVGRSNGRLRDGNVKEGGRKDERKEYWKDEKKVGKKEGGRKKRRMKETEL